MLVFRFDKSTEAFRKMDVVGVRPKRPATTDRRSESSSSYQQNINVFYKSNRRGYGLAWVRSNDERKTHSAKLCLP